MMLHDCCCPWKEKVHKQVSTQMSFIAFKIEENAKMYFSFDPMTFLSWLLLLGVSC